MSLTDSSPLEVAKAASTASRSLATLHCEARNHALSTIHEALQEAKVSILEANARDLKAATEAAENGELSQSVLKRLDLGRKGKLEDMLQGILDVRDLEDPGECCHRYVEIAKIDNLYSRSYRGSTLQRTLYDVVGKITLRTRLDEGLELERITSPIGVLLIIFEARPEVIANIASLAIKSGNAAILKGQLSVILTIRSQDTYEQQAEKRPLSLSKQLQPQSVTHWRKRKCQTLQSNF